MANRPEEFSSFIGRSSEVNELRRLLAGRRAVTLCGAGGIGKTRLALRLLSAVAADFPDGAWFVELGELSQPDQVAARVATAIGVDEEHGKPLAETIAAALGQRRVMLVLDNCEHLIDACASLSQRLLANCPMLQIVATSREPLRVAAEAIWQVPPLSLPPGDDDSAGQLSDYDAVMLFAARAAAAMPGFALGPGNAAGVAAICRALDGLPLAIELAAAWVRVLSVDQIAARLDHRLALLTSSDRAVPARQQTLRATFDWSYDLLTEPERVLLRRLSSLAGWSLDMAERVCSDEILPKSRILDLLSSLATKSLVEVEPEALGESRYRMLDTIREYAGGWLALAGEMTTIRARRREYVVETAAQYIAVGMAMVPGSWSARVDAFRRADLDAANVMEVLADCVADGDAESGLRICAAVSPVWIVRGTLTRGATWIDAFLGQPSAEKVSGAVRGPALVARSQIALARGELPEDMANDALELCRAADLQFWTAAALNLLVEIAQHSGRSDEASNMAEQALTMAKAARDRWNEGYALGTMATIAAGRGNLREAESLAEQALAIMREIDQLWGSSRALLGLADLARLRGDYDKARERYQDALTVLYQLNARPDIARCLAGLGRIALDQSDLPAARLNLSRSLQLSYSSGSRIGIARALEATSRLSVLEGDLAKAVQLAGAIATLRRDAHLPAVPGARTQRLLDAAAGLGEHTIARLWADGAAMTTDAAVRYAVGDSASNATTWVPATADDKPTGALTAREREVVALLGAGMSNRAIAAELFISPATAARHVANILAKLGFNSRSQVAVWARSAELDQHSGRGHDSLS
ncbi:MAG TPA: tetratricopeptide repeat protein [Streptosporangiaceae bacterium]|nr:tetratricopeptide repeat protein [Streptosporangiaceae bacterium]